MQYKVKRISKHRYTNIGKDKFLKEHFDKVKEIKNSISNDIFLFLKNTMNYSLNCSLYDFKLAEYRNLKKELFNDHLSSFEFQKITANIIDHYNSYLTTLL
jgi:UDP-N-acetylglucosamine 2-epimerase